MKRLVKNDVYWVGKTDWELRRFHGDEYSTHEGSTYNSYLIKGEKNILIDTVWDEYSDYFFENLKDEIDLEDIDYIIMNHSEVDHSGALPKIMNEIPDTPIYCTKQGEAILRGHYQKDWNYKNVKTGDKLDIGDGRELIFVEMRMLHWPDSMATYLTGDNILFSNDAFGQHYATENLFNDIADTNKLMEQALKYYANILNPFNPLVTKKIKEILDLELPIDIIAPSHGVIWNENPTQIVEKYMEWADNYKENQITILYDTMWGATREMADKIAEGIKVNDSDVTVKLYNAAKSDKNDMLAEVFKSKLIVVGSSTINNGILHSIAGLLEMIRTLKFKGKKATSFGSYGWTGESVKIIRDKLEESGFEIVNNGLKTKWKPDKKELKEAFDFGKELVT